MEEDDIRRRSYQLKALADPTRLKVVHLLKNRAMCTCEIMAALDLTEPNASHHLNLLERNGIVRSQKAGKWVFYKLDHAIVETMLRDLIR
jgi:ArsR family transcriptional regulator